MSETGAKKTFDVVFEAEGRNIRKFRNDVTVHMRGSAPRTDFLPTDEGPMHGGDGTAPYPLAYFTSGLTACVMTQLRAFSKRLRFDVEEFDVDTRCHWQGEHSGNEPYVSSPVTFRIRIDLRGQLTESEKVELVHAAMRGCFIEVSLKPGIVKHELKVAGEWTALD